MGVIAADSQPSMFVSRLLGGKMVARKSGRYWFGRRHTAIEPMSEGEVFSSRKA